MFKYQFKAPVWHLRFDAASSQLALEVRDADLLLAHFYTFSPDALLLQEIPLDAAKSWWQGLEDTHAGLLLLHGYGDRKLGQHKGITAYAAATQKPQWHLADYTFYGVSAQGIVAFETDSPETGFVILKPETGNVLQTGLNQQEAAAQVQMFAPDRNAACTYPVSYLEGEPYFDEVAQFIHFQLGETPVRAIEYAETGNQVLVSYHVQGADTKLVNKLAAFDADGNLLLKECLGEGLSGLGSDTFIIFNRNLYFVQHKEILRVHSLLQ